MASVDHGVWGVSGVVRGITWALAVAAENRKTNEDEGIVLL